MRHVREDPVVVIERQSTGLGSFFLGLLVGGGLALLLAPQSGEETRAVLRERGQRLREAAASGAEELQDRVEDGYERAKARVEEGFESARRTLHEKRSGARDAYRAGKAAVHSARDELERRLADARSTRDEPSDDDEA